MDDIAALGFRVETSELAKGSTELDRMTLAAQKAENAARGFGSVTNEASEKLRKIGQATAAIDGPLGGIASRFRSLGTLISQTSLSTAALALGIGGAVLALRRFAVGFADAWSDLSARVGLAVGNMDRSASVMERISAIARRTYSSLELTAESFLRNASVLKELGKTTTQQLDFTEALNNALVVSGAKGERAAMVQEALGRAMALGSLRGQELNTVIQSGGRVVELLAKQLGISSNELRRFGNEGKITRDVIYNGVVSAMQDLRDEADRMPATIADSFMILRNSLLQAVGVFDQSNKISETFAKAVISVADSLEMLVKAAIVVGVVFAGRVVAAFLESTRTAVQFYTAVASGNAVLIGGARANEMRARSAFEAAQADRLAAMEKLRDAQATATQLRQTLEMAQAQRAQAAEEVAVARAHAAVTRSTDEVTAALARQHVATRAVIQARTALRRVEDEVAASRLAVAATSSAATKAAINDNIRHAASTDAVAAAEAAHTAALSRTTIAARAASVAMAGLRNVLAFFGGPLGMAFTAIAIGIGYWATRASEATKALDVHRSAVEKIREAYERASDASGEWYKNVAKGTLTQELASLRALQDELKSISKQASPLPAFLARGDSQRLATIDAVNDAIRKFQEGAVDAAQFKATIDNLAQSDKAFEVGFAQTLLKIGDNAISTAEKIREVEAAIRAIKGIATDQDFKTLGLSRPTASPSEDDDAAKARKNFEARLLQARQSVELARQDLALQGASALVQEKMRAQMEVRHQFEEEALKLYGDKNKYDRTHYEALVAERLQLAEINQELKQSQALRDLMFEREQLGRNAIEQTVYDKLNGLGLLTDGKISGAYAQMLAGEVRLTEQMKSSFEIQKDFVSSFVGGMRQGKSAIDAATDALGRLADKLLDSQFDVLFSNLQKGGMLPNLFDLFGSGSGSGWATTILPSAKGNVFSGGNVIPFARGGVVNRPTMFPLANGTGLMGEAGPEAIIPLRRGPGGRLGIDGGGTTTVEVNIVNNSGSEVSQSRRQTNDGEIIDIVIGAVNGGFSGGKFDKSMGGRYGARVAPRQR